jgi:hypothetical protein
MYFNALRRNMEKQGLNGAALGKMALSPWVAAFGGPS